MSISKSASHVEAFAYLKTALAPLPKWLAEFRSLYDAAIHRIPSVRHPEGRKPETLAAFAGEWEKATRFPSSMAAGIADLEAWAKGVTGKGLPFDLLGGDATGYTLSRAKTQLGKPRTTILKELEAAHGYVLDVFSYVSEESEGFLMGAPPEGGEDTSLRKMYARDIAIFLASVYRLAETARAFAVLLRAAIGEKDAVTEDWSPEARAAAVAARRAGVARKAAALDAGATQTEHSPALRQLAEAAGIHLTD